MTPRLITAGVSGLVDFLKAVFGAEGELMRGTPTQLRIGDSRVMVSDGGGVREARSAFFYVYVPDADEAYRRAVALGALHALWRPAGHGAGSMVQHMADRHPHAGVTRLRWLAVGLAAARYWRRWLTSELPNKLRLGGLAGRATASL